MDRKWRAEALAFLEKQKSRLARHCPTGGRVSAYSRDPNLLFALDGPASSTPPLSETQPVIYRDAVLARAFARDFAAGDMVALASVNYLSGMVKFFNANDNDDETPTVCFSDIVRVACRRNERNGVYVDEIIAFLKRGHSLLDARCRCKHGFSLQRCTELGISVDGDRSGVCPLVGGGARPARALADLCKETAVAEIDKVRDPFSGESLLDALHAHESLTLCKRVDTTWVEYTECWIRCAKDLETWVNKHPCGVRIADCVAAGYYAGIGSDIREMVASGELFECHWNLYPKRGGLWPAGGGPVDDDIRALWDACGIERSAGGVLGVSSTRFGVPDLEPLLRAEGLVPAKQAEGVERENGSLSSSLHGKKKKKKTQGRVASNRETPAVAGARLNVEKGARKRKRATLRGLLARARD